ncbi:MAG: universal stress protein [Actinomycetota bacterium]
MTERERGLSRVLVGTDGSARAEEAARQGARIASALGAAFDLVYVVETDRPHDVDVGPEAEAALERAAARARESGIDAVGRIVAGDAADALVAEAREHGADLVCVGPDGGGLGAALHVGRVAKHVLGRADCSVMLARAAGTSFPTKITCGVDGSEASVSTASLASEIASATGAELHFLHVVPVFRGRDSEWTLEPGEESPPVLEPAVRTATDRGLVPVRDMAMGRPEHALVAAARRDRSDLLVVGHRGVRGVGRVLLGSVSEHCAEHAPCSVLVARP